MMMAAKIPTRIQGQLVVPLGYQDTTKELWSDIWNTLMGYIDAEDSPNKLHQKEILVDLMSLFLSRVSHDSKFYLSATPAVLWASMEQASFRPLLAAQAFEALHEYALRILSQPWRSEFTTINMYSGYYVHTVQSRLLKAHELLEEMGFRVDATTQKATLMEPVDVDQVTKAAIDTLMAGVECRIIERILETLPAGAFTPRGVLSYRSAYVGGVEAAVHHLTVTLRQRNFQHYFSPTTEPGGGGGGGAVYPWQPVPAAAAAAAPPLPPVPTARLVDVDERDGCVWIPKTIRHQHRPAATPAAAAPLSTDTTPPGTLDEHQLASWDLVDRSVPARPPPSQSLDDSWGYVLQHIDRRRPLSGRYDNVPEVNANVPRAATLGTDRRGGAETRAPRAGPDQRNPFDSRAHVSSLYQNGNVAPPSADTWNGQAARLPAAGGEAPRLPRSGSGLRLSPRPEPSADPAARPRTSPAPAAEPRTPELGVWPRRSEESRPEPAPRHHDTALRNRETPPRQETVSRHHESAARGHDVVPRGHGMSPKSHETAARHPTSRYENAARHDIASRNDPASKSDPSPRLDAVPRREAVAASTAAVSARNTASAGAPTGPRAASPERQWSCHACTYLNPVSVRVCGMCGKSRPQAGRVAADVPPPPPAAEPEDDLACPQCTLLNSRRARRCGACNAELK